MYDEKRAESAESAEGADIEAGDVINTAPAPGTPWWKRLATLGVETRGVQPVPAHERTDRSGLNVFTFWWTASLTPLAITTGLVGTLFMGLSLEAASLVILCFTLVAGVAPAVMGLLGPTTGMRQIIQSRYSFGLYAVFLVALCNLATTVGWSIVATILAGETLSAVSGGGLSWDLGIVIVSVVSLAIAFMGYRVVHTYERYAWIPALVAIVVATGCGGHLLAEQAPAAPATAGAVLSFGCVIASFTLTWATMASDFAVYVHPGVSKPRLFAYVYAGLVVPAVPLMVLGAAMGGAVPSVPAWSAAFAQGSTGGVMLAMLAPAGGFGKFVAVVIAFSLVGNIAGTMYAITMQFQALLPWCARVPRYVFAVLTTAIVIGAAIPISASLEESLENFLGVISYWGAIYVAIVGTEYLWFRGARPENLDPAIWDDGRQLPLGAAAVASVFIPFGLIVPCMSETWYTGPIAKTTGDIGFEAGFVVCVLSYLVLRTLEKRVMGR